MITLSLPDQSMDIPFGSSFSDVDSKESILVSFEEELYLKLGTNMGDFATTYGIAVKIPHEDSAPSWKYPEGVEGPIPFSITMKEPGGYYECFIAHQLTYTDDRNDYPGLSDEEFANFRNVHTRGMGMNTLYRTASPVDPKHNRNHYADEALRKHHVSVALDLTDPEIQLEKFPGFQDTYFHTIRYFAMFMNMDFMNEETGKQLAEGLRFLADNPGIYAVHCLEGKDRTGIVCALLECFMGAALDEVISDYMVTYSNYYGVKPEDEKYEVISHGNLRKSLQRLFGVKELEHADLSACAEQYLRKIGLTEDELLRLRRNLGTDHK